MEPHPPVDYTESDRPGDVKAAPHVVAVLTAGDLEVPLVVEIRASSPKKEVKGWDRTVECNLEIPSGRLEISECAGAIIAEFAIPPGTYKVRVLSAGLDASVGDCAEARDHYKAILWPS
jgi:hypothetical protein